MKLHSLHLKNYRGFENYQIDFEDDLTVLVGENSSGKTSILEAAAVALGSFFIQLDGVDGLSISRSDAHAVCHYVDGVIDVQQQFPIAISASGSLLGEDVVWERSMDSSTGKTTRKQAKQLVQLSSRVNSRVASGDQSLELPLLAYYGTGRLWKRGSRNMGDIPIYSRLSGYDSCLDSGLDETKLLKWFKKMEIQEVQRMRAADLQNPSRSFAAVKRALAHYFSLVRECNAPEVLFNFDTDDLDVAYFDETGQPHKQGIRHMSDGYRTAMNMVADIAYRMAVLNPALQDEVLNASGVVLIDEVDLHLHPIWQQRVLKDLMVLFPNLQFITTTHAPLVVSSVPSRKLRILTGGESATKMSDETYGGDISRVLMRVMGAEDRPDDVRCLDSRFAELLDEGDLDGAEGLLAQLEQLVGPDDSKVIAARNALSLERMEW